VPPLLVLRALSTLRARTVARHGFRAALLPRETPTTVSGNLRPDPSVRSRGERGSPALAFHLPAGRWFVLRVHATFRVSPPHSPRASVAYHGSSSARGPSQGSFPFSTSGSKRSRTSPGFASPGYVPPSGFRTLLTAFPAPIPPGLFHPGSAHGVDALQSLVPSEEPLRLSAPCALLSFPSPTRLAACPNAVTRGTMVPARRSVRRGCESRNAPASGPCSPRKSVAIQRWFRPPATRCSPGLLPLQGTSPNVPGPTVDTGQLPWAWLAVPASDARPLARSGQPPFEVCRHEGLVVLSRGRPSLLRSPTLSRHSSVRKQRSPSYVFTSGSEPRRRAPQTLFGLSRRAGRNRHVRMLIPAPCRSPPSDRVSVSRDTNG